MCVCELVGQKEKKIFITLQSGVLHSIEYFVTLLRDLYTLYRDLYTLHRTLHRTFLYSMEFSLHSIAVTRKLHIGALKTTL